MKKKISTMINKAKDTVKKSMMEDVIKVLTVWVVEGFVLGCLVTNALWQSRMKKCLIVVHEFNFN